MGKGKKSCFASLFGFNQQQSAAAGARQPEEKVADRPPQQRYYQGTRVRPRDDDDGNYYGGYGYGGDRDIDKKATEFIQRVHRGMLAGGQDG